MGPQLCFPESLLPSPPQETKEKHAFVTPPTTVAGGSRWLPSQQGSPVPLASVRSLAPSHSAIVVPLRLLGVDVAELHEASALKEDVHHRSHSVSSQNGTRQRELSSLLRRFTSQLRKQWCCLRPDTDHCSDNGSRDTSQEETQEQQHGTRPRHRIQQQTIVASCVQLECAVIKIVFTVLLAGGLVYSFNLPMLSHHDFLVYQLDPRYVLTGCILAFCVFCCGTSLGCFRLLRRCCWKTLYALTSMMTVLGVAAVVCSLLLSKPCGECQIGAILFRPGGPEATMQHHDDQDDSSQHHVLTSVMAGDTRSSEPHAHQVIVALLVMVTLSSLAGMFFGALGTIRCLLVGDNTEIEVLYWCLNGNLHPLPFPVLAIRLEKERQAWHLPNSATMQKSLATQRLKMTKIPQKDAVRYPASTISSSPNETAVVVTRVAMETKAHPYVPTTGMMVPDSPPSITTRLRTWLTLFQQIDYARDYRTYALVFCVATPLFGVFAMTSLVGKSIDQRIVVAAFAVFGTLIVLGLLLVGYAHKKAWIASGHDNATMTGICADLERGETCSETNREAVATSALRKMKFSQTCGGQEQTGGTFAQSATASIGPLALLRNRRFRNMCVWRCVLPFCLFWWLAYTVVLLDFFYSSDYAILYETQHVLPERNVPFTQVVYWIPILAAGFGLLGTYAWAGLAFVARLEQLLLSLVMILAHSLFVNDVSHLVNKLALAAVGFCLGGLLPANASLRTQVLDELQRTFGVRVDSVADLLEFTITVAATGLSCASLVILTVVQPTPFTDKTVTLVVGLIPGIMLACCAIKLPHRVFLTHSQHEQLVMYLVKNYNDTGTGLDEQATLARRRSDAVARIRATYPFYRQSPVSSCPAVRDAFRPTTRDPPLPSEFQSPSVRCPDDDSPSAATPSDVGPRQREGSTVELVLTAAWMTAVAQRTNTVTQSVAALIWTPSALQHEPEVPRRICFACTVAAVARRLATMGLYQNDRALVTEPTQSFPQTPQPQPPCGQQQTFELVFLPSLVPTGLQSRSMKEGRVALHKTFHRALLPGYTPILSSHRLLATSSAIIYDAGSVIINLSDAVFRDDYRWHASGTICQLSIPVVGCTPLTRRERMKRQTPFKLFTAWCCCCLPHRESGHGKTQKPYVLSSRPGLLVSLRSDHKNSLSAEPSSSASSLSSFSRKVSGSILWRRSIENADAGVKESSRDRRVATSLALYCPRTETQFTLLDQELCLKRANYHVQRLRQRPPATTSFPPTTMTALQSKPDPTDDSLCGRRPQESQCTTTLYPLLESEDEYQSDDLQQDVGRRLSWKTFYRRRPTSPENRPLLLSKLDSSGQSGIKTRQLPTVVQCKAFLRRETDARPSSRLSSLPLAPDTRTAVSGPSVPCSTQTHSVLKGAEDMPEKSLDALNVLPGTSRYHVTTTMTPWYKTFEPHATSAQDFHSDDSCPPRFLPRFPCTVPRDQSVPILSQRLPSRGSVFKIPHAVSMPAPSCHFMQDPRYAPLSRFELGEASRFVVPNLHSSENLFRSLSTDIVPPRGVT